MSLTVTAQNGGYAALGIQLTVHTISNAALAASPVTATANGAGTASITSSTDGSWIYSATYLSGATAAPTAASGNSALAATLDSSSSGTSTDFSYGSFVIEDTTSGTKYAAGSTDTGSAANLQAVAAEIIPVSGGTITAALAPVSASPVQSTIAAVSLNPPAGSLLVALVSATGNTANLQAPSGSPTGARMHLRDSYGLSWTEVIRNPAVSAGVPPSNYAGIWVAALPSTIATVNTAALPPATAGVPYFAQLVAVGAYAPYSWTLASGSLPAGLTLAADGTIAGTPTATGTSSFDATAEDAYGLSSYAGSGSITVEALP